MKQFRTLLVFGCMLGSLMNLAAQDPRFSQFYAGPQHLNPAMTGTFAGQLRVNLNYRDQWASVLGNNPFRTAAVGIDYRKRVFRGDYFAFGGSVLADRAGVSNFQQTSATLGLSYSKQLSGNRYRTSDQFLVVGAQAGVGQQSFDYGKLWFSRQFDNGTEQINTSLPSGEILNQKSDIYPDIHAGLLWYALFDDDKSVYAGAAMHHINAPIVTFTGQSGQNTFQRYTINAGGQIPFNNQVSLLPATLFMIQGPSLEATYGANLRYANRDWKEIALRFGIWNRIVRRTPSGVSMDALILSSIFELGQTQLGLSYDINTSSFSAATNRRGAFEVSLIYINPERIKYKTRCPKF